MRYLLIVVLLLVSSCALFKQEDKVVLEKTNYNSLNGWESDSHKEALDVFAKSCVKIIAMPDAKEFSKSGIAGKYKNWKEVCQKAGYLGQNSDEQQARKFFEENFTPYIVKNNSKQTGLFTGYYEARLNGSRTKQGIYQYPVYAKPSELTNGDKYYTREEINNGVLNNRGLELFYVSDPVELYFLHVQGSGVIALDDGSSVRIGYDGKNGQKYVALGKYFIDNGIMVKEEVSADSIKNWLRNNPQQADYVMNQNPSYVFFRQIDSKEQGPIGAMGVALTPMRSIAVDNRFIPYGAPLWLETDTNQSPSFGAQYFRRLMIAQDTGGAIRGPVRGDIFFGMGDHAEELAGYKNGSGNYAMLLPNNIGQ